MHLYNHHLTEAFTHACHTYRLHPAEVLQAFVDVLSVETNLFAGSGLPFWAGRVFSLFTRSTEPVFPLHPVKRERGIRSIRKILRVSTSLANDDEKTAAHKEIMDSWCFANGLPQAQRFTLESWPLELTGYYLLVCDLFRTAPENPLLFLMQTVVNSSKEDAVDCPALCFIHQCVQEVYAIEKN